MYQKSKNAKAPTVQKISPVTIALQLFSGDRLMSDFKPEVSLWEILKHWEKEGKLVPSLNSLTNEVPVCIYLRKEIASEESLKNTTLAVLGLLNGKAVIRYNSKPEGFIEQPHIGGVLMARPSVSLETQIVQDTTSRSPVAPSESVEDIVLKQEAPCNQDNIEMVEVPGTIREKPIATENVNESENQSKVEPEKELDSTEITSIRELIDIAAIDDGGTINFLNEAGFLIYVRPQQTIAAVKIEEYEQEDFFELTEEDIRKRMHDLVHQRRALEEAHFLTAEQRSEKETERQHKLLQRYPFTLLRVQFSDGFILQMPLPSDCTISQVKTELLNYITSESKEIGFELFTAPPKNVIDTSTPLHLLGLTPSSLVYISSHCLIKEEHCISPSSFMAAARDAYRRITAQDQEAKSEHFHNKKTTHGAKPGGSSFTPKWLKLSKN